MDSGFKQLTGALQGVRDADANQVQIQKDNNTNAAKDILASYQTPEALEAARATGELEAQLKGLGDNIDPNVVRDGFDNRQGELRTQANDTFEYETNQAKQEAAPLEQAFYKALAEDKDGEAQMILDNNADLFGKAGIAGKL